MQAPPFDNPDRKLELVRRINSIPGVTIPEDLGRFPKIDLVKLADGDRLQRFLDAMNWAVEQVKKELSSCATTGKRQIQDTRVEPAYEVEHAAITGFRDTRSL